MIVVWLVIFSAIIKSFNANIHYKLWNGLVSPYAMKYGEYLPGFMEVKRLFSFN